VNDLKRSGINKIYIISLFLPVILLFSACASIGSFSAIENELEYNRYAESIVQLENNKNLLYTGRDTVLYNLDRGMLSHYAKFYTDSSILLGEAERAIEEAFTKSISQEISTFLTNDNARDYGGEDYEDIYINAFNALNYYHRGLSESTLVEVRRMNNKLRYLNNKYDVSLSNLQKKAIEENQKNIPPNPNAPSKFSDSALARYLGMLFYRGAGMEDDVRIDRDHLLAAFANAPEVYKHQVPKSLSGEMYIPRGMARLNVIAFGGLSPIKIETVIRIPLPEGRWIKIALPEMQSRQSAVNRVELVIDGGGSYEFELLEDIDAVARETFKLRAEVIYLKTVIRATIKSVSSSALSAAARETSGNESLVLGLFSLFAQVIAEVSESADIRIARFFPARAYIAGINLPPGNYSFSVKYYNRQGREIAVTRHENMAVRENVLNLAEAVCLR